MLNKTIAASPVTQAGMKNGFESTAARMIEKYPEGRITDIEVGWPCRSAIRAPVRGLDTPVAFFQGSYQELRAFENAFHRARIAKRLARPEAFRPFDTLPSEEKTATGAA